ncbi:MAG TPA: hypothetical protein VK978_04940, partial [Candidatus Saccharimonadales bacterium]|nr:hypothetical protein [Candidatus Saccharimonadales bacterium]
MDIPVRHDDDNPVPNQPIGRLDAAWRAQRSKRPSQPQAAQHITVQDADTQSHANREEPLSAYMVSPHFLSREVVSRMAPKRPLSQAASSARQPSAPRSAAPKAQPAVFHERLDALPMPLRIRRSRTPAAAVTEQDVLKHQPLHRIDTESRPSQRRGRRTPKALLVLLAGWLTAKFLLAKKAVAEKLRTILPIGDRLHYSLGRGAAHKLTLPSRKFFAWAVPVLVLISLLGLGTLTGLFRNESPSGSQAGGNNQGTAGGNRTESTTSQGQGSGTESAGQNGANPGPPSSSGSTSQSGGTAAQPSPSP